MVALIEDKDKLRRWMICGPEVLRAVSYFDDATVLKNKENGEIL